MGQKITIEPVTRIEGHGRVTIHLNDNGDVEQTFSMLMNFAVWKNSAREDHTLKCLRLPSAFAGSVR